MCAHDCGFLMAESCVCEDGGAFCILFHFLSFIFLLSINPDSTRMTGNYVSIDVGTLRFNNLGIFVTIIDWLSIFKKSIGV